MFYLADRGRITPVHSLPLNGLIAVDGGLAQVFVGASSGLINVSVEPRSVPPEQMSIDDWECVVDVSMVSVEGEIVILPRTSAPPGLPPITAAGSGHYRVRVHARGRDAAPDEVAFLPVEDYLIIAWPAAPSQDIVHKQTDAYGAVLRESAARMPTQPPALETDDDRRRKTLDDRLGLISYEHHDDA